MNYKRRSNLSYVKTSKSGFALILSLAIMAFIVMLVLSLSSFVLSEIKMGNAQKMQHLAQLNAKYSMTVALAALQEEMGPDMRVSAESAIFDKNIDTERIDGLAQSHWLASYNSWGNWLNADYSPPGTGRSLSIQDTYVDRREPMFRRWLLSLPEGAEEEIRAPFSLNGWNEKNSIILVGNGSLGERSADKYPDRVTRAYLQPIAENGKMAWWIGPENHKVDVNVRNPNPQLSEDQWETSHGDTPDKGAGFLDGFDVLNKNAEELSGRLLSPKTLAIAKVDLDEVQDHYYDLTSGSKGVLASVRSGHLKKDLSLMFENEQMPDTYGFKSGDVREPSIRPMSDDLIAYGPRIPERHFASWTNMRNFYRMYHESHFSEIHGHDKRNRGGTDGSASGSLKWSNGVPYTEAVVPTNVGLDEEGWSGQNHYWRVPVLAKMTYIFSLMTLPHAAPGHRGDHYLAGPSFVYWNPYNTEMRIPSGALGIRSSANSTLMWAGELSKPDGSTLPRFWSGPWAGGSLQTKDQSSADEIIFKPGEFKMFSFKTNWDRNNENPNDPDKIRNHRKGWPDNNSYFPPITPGFDSANIGGLIRGYYRYKAPYPANGFKFEIVGAADLNHYPYGNTPGGFSAPHFWTKDASDLNLDVTLPLVYAHDWLQVKQTRAWLNDEPVLFDWSTNDTKPTAYVQLTIKGVSELDYESIDWAKDWRCRNWIQAPPYYFGSAMYISEDEKIAHTQRLDSPYQFNFGPLSDPEILKVSNFNPANNAAYFGSGPEPVELVNSIVALELPTAPVASLAGFSGMRMNPGWLRPDQYGEHLSVDKVTGRGSTLGFVEGKAAAYQSGITGPGIGNSFMHPMLKRDEVYQYFNNSVARESGAVNMYVDPPQTAPWYFTSPRDNMMFNDYWDHVFLLNDALWDDYFVSSIADQTRKGAGMAYNLNENIERLTRGESLANSRYLYHRNDYSESEVVSELTDIDGYLNAAKHLMVDGMFNVNSTSLSAWYSLFASIRGRILHYRDSNGNLEEVDIPSGQLIAISRLNTPVIDEEMDDPADGVDLGNGLTGWSGVRFLSESQVMQLAKECVKQVKMRGPFLNFSEFINRRLSNDDMGTMGALQSAIDFDNDSPNSNSINYRFKRASGQLIDESDLGDHAFNTPEAAVGSRYAGIPGYVIQTDLLKPISNVMSVRDDTFRIRSYGDVRNDNDKVIASAWCEAIVQRIPQYCDLSDDANVPAQVMDKDGNFEDSNMLSKLNEDYGRRFRVVSFRWLKGKDI